MESGGGGFMGGKAATGGGRAAAGRGRGRGMNNDNSGCTGGGRGGYQYRTHYHQQQHGQSGVSSQDNSSYGGRGGAGGYGCRGGDGAGRGGGGAGGRFSGSSGRGGRGRRGSSRGSASSQDIAAINPEHTVQQMQPLNLSRQDNSSGKNNIRTISLRVNHFLLSFDPESIIRHYDFSIKPDVPARNSLPMKVPKTILSMIRNKLFSDDPTRFPLSMTVYDGEKNIFSTVSLPTGKFKVELSKNEGIRIRSFMVELQLVNELKCDKLNDYLRGRVVSVPREVLQALDVVMKENPMRQMIYAGRIFHPIMPYPGDDLRRGITASRGIKHTLKPTSQGLALCLDYSVLPLLKQMPVIDFLKEHIRGFNLNNFRAFRREVERVLKELKVTVNHRTTGQKFKIAGLTHDDTQDISFEVDRISERKVWLVDYFKEKYNKNITHRNIPCLDLGKKNRTNYVPMEFCSIAKGQRFAMEDLDRNQSEKLRRISLASPKSREGMICDMIQSSDGPCGGDISQNFGIGTDLNMTKVTGRVLAPPELKLGNSGGRPTAVDRDKCHWNLFKKSVVHSKPIRLWGVLNFGSNDLEKFIPELISNSEKLGIHMDEPLFCLHHPMNLLHNVDNLQQLLESVNNECYKRNGGEYLQILVCVLPKEDPGYSNLKWICETKVGIVTQCCLSENAFRPKAQFLANLALKINAKLGGSNVELFKQPQCLQSKGHVMFIGADVNHPSSYNSTSPSIAAVVATMNWPAANQYGALICPQDHRAEKILKFGDMCLELVNAYARLNQVRPENIVVFRDGVSESQFDMVLNEELKDIKAAFESLEYFPTITLIVAQKRHTTRLFLDSDEDENVPPGTVVDTVITSPSGSDIYLCSHFGQIGTSKPAHYQVLQNEIEFTPNELQEFIYSICFTSAQCTKPVSLVPPVIYADRAAFRGRLYYNAMELHQPSAPSTSSSSLASFDEQPFRLHPNLENSMFYI